MKKQGMKSMIVDVRQDPGGLLDQAIKIANMFVPEGRTILQTEDRNGSREKYVAESGTKITVPAVVMIDGGSASASEILAKRTERIGRHSACRRKIVRQRHRAVC